MSNRQSPKRVLIAPLDWGLGHATRCIPIINELKKRNTEVLIASSGNALILLKGEFPELAFFEIASYHVHYSRKLPFFFSLLFQIPKFLSAIKKEHRQIETIVHENKVDFVISDNRFGCWTKHVHSVFITHQVNLLTPAFLKWIEPLANYFNHNQIRKFDQCWVPDELQNRITGKLSASDHLNLNYVGMLSRLKKSENVNKKFDLLILLSGPEPQRTVMEEVILKQLPGLNLKALLVRGLPGNADSLLQENEHVTIKNYLNTGDLNRAMEESEIVICRSGYSSIMDLATLNKKAIFIPTHGQTEQEYLAQVLSERRIAFCTSLDQLDIAEALKLSSGFSGFTQTVDSHLLLKALDELPI